MRYKIIFPLFTIAFFFLYLQVMSWLWNRFFDIDPIVNVLALLVTLVLIIPLSALSAHISIDMIKREG